MGGIIQLVDNVCRTMYNHNNGIHFELKKSTSQRLQLPQQCLIKMYGYMSQENVIWLAHIATIESMQVHP